MDSDFNHVSVLHQNLKGATKMKELRKLVDEICRHDFIPAGFGVEQCQAIVRAYNDLTYETKCFTRDRQVYSYLKSKLGFPAKAKGNGLYVVWQKNLITVVK